MKTGNKFTLVTTAKNEGPYFLEWIAYHRLIGFQNFIVFQNDSDDFTHEILACLASLGIITYKYNRAGVGRQQVNAYRRAAKQPDYLKADWVMALDMDEFLCLHAPLQTLDQWFGKLPEADQIFVNWAMFGNSGHTGLTDDLVTSRFHLASVRESGAGKLRSFKTLFRREAFQRPGIHMPRGLPEEAGARPAIRSINGSGLSEPKFERKNYRSTDPQICRYAQINHYIVRDAESFVLKAWKGSAHQENRSVDQNYWIRRNRNRSSDTSLVLWAGKIQAEMNALDKASGGELMRLRALSIDAHRAKFQQIIKEDEYRDLYDFCCLNNGIRSII